MFNRMEHAERTRRWIAVGIMSMFGLIIFVLALAAAVYSIQCWTDTERCTAASTALSTLATGMQPVFTALTGLVGSVVGFYFGSRQNDTNGRRGEDSGDGQSENDTTTPTPLPPASAT